MNDKQVQEAIKKQEPMKPVVRWDIILHDVAPIDFSCPACDSGVWRFQKHCEECGQKLDWSGVDELASNSR